MNQYKVLLTALSLVLGTPAYATNGTTTPPPTATASAQGGKAGAEADSYSRSNADSTSSSESGDSTSGASSDNSVSISESNRDRLQAPSVFAPSVYASGPCSSGWSAGASVPGAGASFGRSKTDAGCDRRELARVLTPLNPSLALKILCADPLAREVALPEDCVYPTKVEVSRPTEAPVASREDIYVTREELKRVFEKTMSK